MYRSLISGGIIRSLSRDQIVSYEKSVSAPVNGQPLAQLIDSE
jgi:hypothetical protein